MSKLLVLLALSGCVSKSPPAATPTSEPAAAATVPGAANLALACRAPAPSCEDPGFDMAVLGDRVASCEVQPGTGSIRLHVDSTDDPHDLVILALDGYHGPGSYALDEPGSRFLSVDDHVSFPQCEGPPIEVGKRVSAADPNCGSPACTVGIDDPEPGGAFPRRLTFTVHCASLCENGSDVVCEGPFDFTLSADCG